MPLVVKFVMPLWIGPAGIAVSFCLILRILFLVIKQRQVGRWWWVGTVALSLASVIAICTAQPVDEMIVLSGGSDE